MARLELLIMAGAESKEFLADLTKQIDRLEKLKGLDGKTANTDEAEETVDTDDGDDDEDFGTKKKKASKKVSKSFDEEEDEEAEEEADDDGDEDPSEDAEADDDEPAPKVKAGKAKKLTVDDCNDAAKALASKHGRTTVLDLMKKHFKTKSVSELKPDQYGKFVELMKKAETK